MKNEFKHLLKLKNENVIKVTELIIDSPNATVYLIMEYFEGKELFVLLSEIGHYNGFLIRGSRQESIQTTTLWNCISSQKWNYSSRFKTK